MADEFEKKLSDIGDDFQIRILEAALKGNPDDFNVLFALGNAYTQAGRYDEGLAVDRKLTQMKPDNAVVHYNLACSLSLLERVDEALDELGVSFELGYREYNHVLSDPDLERVRRSDRFSELIERYLHSDGKTG